MGGGRLGLCCPCFTLIGLTLHHLPSICLATGSPKPLALGRMSPCVLLTLEMVRDVCRAREGSPERGSQPASRTLSGLDQPGSEAASASPPGRRDASALIDEAVRDALMHARQRIYGA